MAGRSIHITDRATHLRLKWGGFVPMSTRMRQDLFAAGEVGTACSSFATITALIVDDEAHVRSYLRMALHQLGVTAVWEAANGRQALDLYQQHQPTVVLLDVRMPVMSGEEVMRELGEIDPNAVVIVVTSLNDYEVVKRFIQFGATNYVLKHLPREQLVAMISDVLLCLTDEVEDED
jgi:two-component system, chemotaxis family, chemotaxis protein CheY